MPTYQYQCTECSHALEVHQSFTEDALTVCPECEGRLRKVFNAVGVVFKGSGFYATDSRAKQTASSSASSEHSHESHSESKVETKSEPKPESTPAKTETTSTPAKKTSAAGTVA